MTTGLLGAGIGGAFGWFAFSQFTPQGRYQRAMNVVNDASSNKLLTSAFSNIDDLKHCLRTRYLGHPAAGAYLVIAEDEELTPFYKNLQWAKSMLQYAQNEQSASFSLQELCKVQEQVVDILLYNCEVALELIHADKEEYYHHRKIYDAYLQRKQMQQMLDQKNHAYWQKEMHHLEKMAHKKIN